MDYFASPAALGTLFPLKGLNFVGTMMHNNNITVADPENAVSFRSQKSAVVGHRDLVSKVLAWFCDEG